MRRVHRDGERAVVVLSAVAGVTDALERAADANGDAEGIAATEEALDLYRDLAGRFDVDVDRDVARAREVIALGRTRRDETGRVRPRARAEIASAGETLSVALGTARLRAAGLDVDRVDARELLEAEDPPPGTCPTDRFLAATCRREVGRTPSALVAVNGAVAVLTQGYLARDSAGRTVLLGRGGSDTAAAEIAARLRARRLEIWSDVPGVFTADPRSMPSARLVPDLDYAEAETLAAFGAAVLHPRCIGPARDAGVPVHLRWTERPDHPGTRIGSAADVAAGAVGIVVRDDLRLMTLERPHDWQPVGFMADVAERFRRHGLSMDLVSSSPGRILTTLDPAAAPGLDDQVDDLLSDLCDVCDPEPLRRVASVAIVGRELPRTLPDVGRALASIDGTRPLMVTHGGDGRSVVFVVPTAAASDFARGLHDALFGDGANVAGCGPTWAELSAEPLGVGSAS